MQVPAEPNIDPCDFRDMVNLAIPGPNYVNKTVKPHTNLNIAAWEAYAPVYLEHDPTLLDQLTWGFPTGVPQEAILSVPFTNHTSARRHPHIVEEYINKHLRTKALYGPFNANPLDIDIIVSPLQVAFSRSGKARVCNDLSFGDHSVNDSISSTWSEYPGYYGDLSLPTADDLIQAILDIGPGAMLWKTDFSAYYKQLNIDLAQINTLAFAFDNKIYFESRLPFGLRSSCLNAQRVTTAAIRIYNSKSPSFATGYVDDIVGCSLNVVARRDYDLFWQVTDDLGMEKTLEKCEPPAYSIVWTGLQFDTVNMEISLPEEKKDRIIALLEDWLTKNRASKTALQSLLGTLNHAASVVIIGRAFTGHILDLIKHDAFPVILGEQFKADVRFWLQFLKDSQVCKAAFKSPRTHKPDSILQISVSGNKFAIRAHDSIAYFQCDYGDKCDSAITFIHAVWMASMVFVDIFKSKWITFIVPTIRLVHTINRARAVLTELRPMVRQTWWVQAQNDFVLRAKLGSCNRFIDDCLHDCDEFETVSKDTVPEYFQC